MVDGITNPSASAMQKALSKQELQKHCRRCTRGTEETVEAIESLLPSTLLGEIMLCQADVLHIGID